MTDETMRAEFERWAADDEDLPLEIVRTSYRSLQTEYAWLAFQAGRASALSAGLVEALRECIDVMCDLPPEPFDQHSSDWRQRHMRALNKARAFFAQEKGL